MPEQPDPDPAPAPPRHAAPPQLPPAPPERWWRRGRSWWELFLQFFAVLLGVVAATSVNTWREERAARATVEHARQSLANEVALNRAHLAERTAYYRTVVRELDTALRARGDEATLADVPTMTGLNPPFLRQAAYQVSFHTGAFARLDYGQAERVAAVYGLQNWMLGLVDKSTDVVVRGASDGLALRDLRRAFSDWAAMGSELERAYHALLAELPAPAASPNAAPASSPGGR